MMGIFNGIYNFFTTPTNVTQTDIRFVNTPTDVQIYDMPTNYNAKTNTYEIGLTTAASGATPSNSLTDINPVQNQNSPLPSINQVVQPNVPTVPEVKINIPEVVEKSTAMQQSQGTEETPPHTSSQGSEAKQYLETAQIQTNDDYEAARQYVINECNAIITEAPTEAEKLQQLAEDNPDTLKSALNIGQAVTDIADWTDGFLDPQLQFTKASEGIVGLEGIRRTEIDKATVSKVNQAVQSRNKVLAEVLRDYDPNNTGDTVKKLTDLNRDYKQKVSNIWINQTNIAPTSQSSNQPLTVSQKFKNAVGMSPEYAANAAESGRMRALAKGVRKMSVFQGANLVLSAAGIAADVYEHREDLEYALITKDGSLTNKLKDLKSNVSKDTWNTIVEDTIDASLLTVDVIAGAALTPLGGAALGVFVLHPTGALLKSLYYKKEYGSQVDFGKTFVENLKLGNHDHFVLKPSENIGNDDYPNNDTFTLYGSIEETDWYDFAQDDNTLRTYAQKIVLEGYINDLLLLGEVDETILHGKISYDNTDIDIVQPIKPNKNNESFVIYGDDAYGEVGDPPPIMPMPEKDIDQCQSAQGSVSEEEVVPSLDPEFDVGIVSPTKPKFVTGAEVDIIEPPEIIDPKLEVPPFMQASEVSTVEPPLAETSTLIEPTRAKDVSAIRVRPLDLVPGDDVEVIGPTEIIDPKLEVPPFMQASEVSTLEPPLDFLCDNNFITDEIGIDSISEVSENNYSAGKIEMETNSKFSIGDIISYNSSFNDK